MCIEYAAFHMECEVLEAMTNKVIQSSQTSQPQEPSQTCRDVKIVKYSAPQSTPLIIRVTTNQTCYLYVINIGSSGNLITLIPNEYDANNEASPHQTVQFPPANANYSFEIDAKSDTEIIVVLSYACKQSVAGAENDCRKIRDKEAHRDVMIKENPIVPLGVVEMQFSVKR